MTILCLHHVCISHISDVSIAIGGENSSAKEWLQKMNSVVGARNTTKLTGGMHCIPFLKALMPESVSTVSIENAKNKGGIFPPNSNVHKLNSLSKGLFVSH